MTFSAQRVSSKNAVKHRITMQLILGVVFILAAAPVAGDTVNLLCVRHAQSKSNTKGGKARYMSGMALAKCTFVRYFKRWFQNPYLTDEGCKEALERGNKLLENDGFLHGKNLKDIGNVSSPLNRTVQTWFLMMSPYVKKEMGSWNNAIKENFKLLITPDLREAHDNGNQDSFGPETIKQLKKQLTSGIRKCRKFLQKSGDEYKKEFFPTDVLSVINFDIMYTGYKKAALESNKEKLSSGEDVTSEDRDVIDKLTSKKSWWKWDNRKCRNNKLGEGFGWRENHDPSFIGELRQEIESAKKVIAQLKKPNVIAVSHGQKLQLWFRFHAGNFSKAIELDNAEAIPMKLNTYNIYAPQTELTEKGWDILSKKVEHEKAKEKLDEYMDNRAHAHFQTDVHFQ